MSEPFTSRLIVANATTKAGLTLPIDASELQARLRQEIRLLTSSPPRLYCVDNFRNSLIWSESGIPTSHA